MALVAIGIVIFLILVLIALRIAASRQVSDDSPAAPVLRGSGVYSIVRQNPREALLKLRPSENAIRQYLAGVNEDNSGNTLSEDDKNALVVGFFVGIEAVAASIDEGDKQGAEFYFYDYSKPDIVCEKMVPKGAYVRREDLYSYPELIPPFHLGCTCELRPQTASVDIRKTIALKLQPFVNGDTIPPLPSWTTVQKPA